MQVLWATGMEKSWWSEVPPIALAAFFAANLLNNSKIAIERPLNAVRKLMIEMKFTMISNMASIAVILRSE